MLLNAAFRSARKLQTPYLKCGNLLALEVVRRRMEHVYIYSFFSQNFTFKASLEQQFGYKLPSFMWCVLFKVIRGNILCMRIPLGGVLCGLRMQKFMHWVRKDAPTLHFASLMFSTLALSKFRAFPRPLKAADTQLSCCSEGRQAGDFPLPLMSLVSPF